MNGRKARLLGVAITAAATLAMGARASTTPSAYKVLGAFGKAGTGNGQFSGAKGIAIAPNGNVFIADSNNNRVEVFSKSGVYRSKWGTIGSDNGQFTGARDVAVAPDGTVWVADDNNARAQGFSITGGWKSIVAVPNESARGVAADAAGNVYVAAEGGERAGFRVFPGGNDVGHSDLLGAGAFSVQDVEVSPDGTVFLATSASNTSNVKVRHFTKDGKSLGIFSLPNITGIGVDSDCNIWAGDFNNRGVAKYSPTGRRLAAATYPDLQAQDIAAKNGDVYVTQLNGPIVHFAEDRSKPATAAIPARLTVARGPVVRIMYTLRGAACPSAIKASATLTGPGISGTSSNLLLKAGKANAIAMRLAARSLRTAPASGKATFKITLGTNGRPTVETRTVTVVIPASVR